MYRLKLLYNRHFAALLERQIRGAKSLHGITFALRLYVYCFTFEGKKFTWAFMQVYTKRDKGRL